MMPAMAAHRPSTLARGAARPGACRPGQVSEAFAVHIHPAVPTGHGVVVGETATVGHELSILRRVTLAAPARGRATGIPGFADGVLPAAGRQGRSRKRGAGGRALVRDGGRCPGPDRGLAPGCHLRPGHGPGPRGPVPRERGPSAGGAPGRVSHPRRRTSSLESACTAWSRNARTRRDMCRPVAVTSCTGSGGGSKAARTRTSLAAAMSSAT